MGITSGYSAEPLGKPPHTVKHPVPKVQGSGMADQFAVVPFTTPSPAAQFDITTNAITETVTAVILVYSRATTDDADRTHGLMGFGMYADDGVQLGSGPENSICPHIISGSTTERVQTPKDGGAIMFSPLEGSTDLPGVEYTYNSFIPGGVRLDSSIATNSQLKGYAILFAGTSRAYADRIPITGALATETTGGASPFTPDLVIMSGHDGAYGGPTYHNEGVFALGFLTPDGANGHVCTWENATDPTVSRGYVASGSFPTFNNSSTFLESDLSIVTNGFQRQRVVPASGVTSPDIIYIALKFTDPDIAVVATNLTAPSGTGAQAYSLGFQPALVMGMSSLQTVQDSLTNTAVASVAGLLAFDDTEQRAITIRRDQGASSAAASTRTGDYGILTYNDAGSVAQQATRTLTASGFSLNFTTATSGLFTVLAIGGGSTQLDAPTETVSIGDEVGFWTFLEVDTETVVIGDALGNTVTTKAIGNAPALGTTAHARSQQGRTVGSHSQLGRTEG